MLEKVWKCVSSEHSVCSFEWERMNEGQCWRFPKVRKVWTIKVLPPSSLCGWAEANLLSSVIINHLRCASSLCLAGAWVCACLRTPCPPRCRLRACSSVCCWAPVPCWSRRRASPCSECACSTMPWCSAASLSSSKHTGFLLCLCFICLFLILIYVAMVRWACTQFFSNAWLYICTAKLIYTWELPTATIDNLFWSVFFLKLCAQIAGIRRTLSVFLMCVCGN